MARYACWFTCSGRSRPRQHRNSNDARKEVAMIAHTMTPEELSQQLRHGSGAYMAQRRGIVSLSLMAVGSMGLITFYQMGVIKHLPEPPLPNLNADKVDASAEAYSRF